jgi:phosphoribosylformylglycinamidine cyclo-ligase
MPTIFSTLQKAGNVEQSEMYRTFNMGIGMVLAVTKSDVDDILSRLNGLGEQAWLLGEVKAMTKNQTDQVVLG